MARTPASLTDALGKLARRHPDVEEGVACKGTSLESRTYKVKGKAFLFVRPAEARLKLDASLSEATKLAEKDPETYSAGSKGWVAFKLAAAPPKERLERWIAESYALFAGSQVKPKKK
jgi:hypothetical protein